MQVKFETENVLFGVFVTALLGVTLAMGLIAYRQKPHPADKTLTVLIPATSDSIKMQDALTAEYKKSHPDIYIRYVMFPWQNIWQKLEYMIVANIPPDVSGIEQPNLPRFLHLGAVEPLDKWIKNDPDFDPSTLFPQCMNEGNWDGLQYGLPEDWSTVCLWYNRDLFDEAGIGYPNRDWTREDLIEAARKLTKDLDGDGWPDQWGFFTNNNHWHRYSCWIWMTGGEFFTPDLLTSLFDDPKVVDGFDWLAGLSLRDKVMPSANDPRNIGSTNLFLSGRMAMIAETRYTMAAFGLERYKDIMKNFVWDVSELPHDKNRATVFVCGLSIIPSTVPEKRKPMAWDYLKFCSSEGGQRIIATLPGALPARMDIAREVVNHPGLPPENDEAFIRSIEYARYPYRPFPAEPQWMEARSLLQGVWGGTLEVDDVCKQAAIIINKAMEDYFRFHPDAKLPLKTDWVPFDKRTEAVASEEATGVSAGG